MPDELSDPPDAASGEAGPAEPAGLQHLPADTLRAFAGQGALAAQDPDYRQRPGQQQMAEAIARAIVEDDILMVDAGTGIGKTFAYLVPALLSGRRVLLSTATRQLQDQLHQRDLPRVCQALGLDTRIAILKGRSNYVCPVHLARNLRDGRFRDPGLPARLRIIERFASLSDSGDKAACTLLAEDDLAWQFATSTADNCLHHECPELRQCPLMRARQQAQKADVVVVNHHLFCADLALKDESIGDFLPKAGILIFDEAHQLPDIATEFFGEAVSTRQLLDLGRESLRHGQQAAAGLADWHELAQQLERAAARLRLALPEGSLRLGIEELLGTDAGEVNEWLSDALPPIIATVQAHVEALRPLSALSPDLARLEERGTDLLRRLKQWQHAFWRACGNEAASPPTGSHDDAPTDPTAPADRPPAAPEQAPVTTGTAPAAASVFGAIAGQLAGSTDAVRAIAEQHEQILWVQTTERHAQLRTTPLSVAERFAAQRTLQGGAWVFVSATLALQGSIGHFSRQMGMTEAQQLLVDSPFDYPRQAALWLPRLGSPTAPGFPERVADCALPLLRKNRGRAFVLCTTLRAVRLIAERLRAHCAETITILAQGDAPRHELMERFRKQQPAVLVGSAGFWEGVDIAGEQLSLVVIDKLPFAPPDDPIVRARSQALQKIGQRPFDVLSVPQATLALKQGAGRLIRTENDRGLLVICDERLATRAYGRRILDSLPPFARLESEGEALDFITAMQDAAGQGDGGPLVTEQPS
ncbi:MAG: ATP-dependent DNA helicase [Lautropia sp.]|nr:ATP-dependent DNA helicase [Lautropia sp.]